MIMLEDDARAAFIIFFILVLGKVGFADSALDSDKQILLSLKKFLENSNPVNQGVYSGWNQSDQSPCNWTGVSCSMNAPRVIGLNLSANKISGNIFNNFSALSELNILDLSSNTIGGVIPPDLRNCQNLKILNLSHNILEGELNLSRLVGLKVLDVSQNRFNRSLQSTLAGICGSLEVLNISINNFTGEIGHSLYDCENLKYVDLGSNNLTGALWFRFDWLIEFSISKNQFRGWIPSRFFPPNCTLEVLDFSENTFVGGVPKEVSNCKGLKSLDLYGNSFTGKIPSELGLLSNLQALFLGDNNFSRDIPESLLGLKNLTFLDVSRNNFGGNIQEIFGKFTQLRFLILRENSFEGGMQTSGVLTLQNLYRLDLSYNNFKGPLPVEIAQMTSLKFLMLASCQFSGSIPSEYGNLSNLQALDLSNNHLNGLIPPSFGKLSSLLWLMLANNWLTGNIPPELGNCNSLLWLNLANNRLSGKIPPELASIGRNPQPTFLLNQKLINMPAGTGECSAMKRWIPADYPPFSFVYILLDRKKCRALWQKLLKGDGLFPMCVAGSDVRTFQISGYVQLNGNQLSGEVPPEMGKMENLSILHMGFNQLNGTLPNDIGNLPLMVLNLTKNHFSGEIPIEIGNINCLRNLDLSYNNFSGAFPLSLSKLTDLSMFNISYNPLISGTVPQTAQWITFDKLSFLGNPMLELPFFIDNSNNNTKDRNIQKTKSPKKVGKWFWAILALALAFSLCGVTILMLYAVIKIPIDGTRSLIEDTTSDASSQCWSNIVEDIRLNKDAFTYADILKATGSFSVDNIIGVGGSGTVYLGVLPDGRQVAVKKLEREGREGEREFLAEMEVLRGNSVGWPHPNLVTLYGWCLYGSEKLLVYEYMESGTLDDLIEDQTSLPWRKRLDVAFDVACALFFLHHECFPAIVHRDIKASNVLIDKKGKARVTDFGLARFVDAGCSHVSTMVAGTIGYVPPEYGQTWQATTKGDVYSYGVLAMELATGRRAVDAGQEFLVEWVKKVTGNGRQGFEPAFIPADLLVSSELAEGMCELLKIGIRCTAETPWTRPNMKEVLAVLIMISNRQKHFRGSDSPDLVDEQ